MRLGMLGALGMRRIGGIVGCIDTMMECPAWAKAGYCSKELYYSYMISSCCRSCRAITTGVGGGIGIGGIGGIGGGIGGIGGIGGGIGGQCVDANARDCQAWAAAGFCSNPKYVYYMKQSCCASCQGRISGRIRESPTRYESPYKYVQAMNVELKKKKK